MRIRYGTSRGNPALFIFYMHPLFMRKFFAILLENQYSEEAQISQEILISLFED